jgi:hypothetical protein
VESSTGGNGVKRWIFTILLFLILGAVVNIAVAWGCAWWVMDYTEVDRGKITTAVDAEGRGIEWWEAKRDEGFGSTLFGSTRWRATQGMRVVTEGTAPSELLPSWAHFDEPGEKFAGALLRGWPCRALACWSRPSRDGSSELLMGIFCGFIEGDFPRVLPLRPLWPGFLINTVFYGLILWLIICGPFVLRRLIRIKRGRCPKCGYDLRGAPPEVGAGGGCPECGWNRPPETESARGVDAA